MGKQLSNEQLKRGMQLLIQINRAHRNICERQFRALGIHRSQHSLLLFLARNQRPISQKEIAQAFEISQAAVATSLKRLQNNGYIEKTPAKKDNRYNEIKITAKGREMVQKSDAVFSQADALAFEGMEESEYLQLTEYLMKIKRNLYPAGGEEKQ